MFNHVTPVEISPDISSIKLVLLQFPKCSGLSRNVVCIFCIMDWPYMHLLCTRRAILVSENTFTCAAVHPSIPYVCRPLSCSHHTLFLPPTQQDTDNKMQRSVSTATPSLNNNKCHGLVCVFRTFYFEVEYLSIAGLSGG